MKLIEWLINLFKQPKVAACNNFRRSSQADYEDLCM